MTKTINFYKIFSIIIGFLLIYFFYNLYDSNQNTKGEFKIVFFDVGQGDSIFIEDEKGFQILIDGGKGNKVLSELSKVMPFYDRSIDMVIATHWDADHIGGLIPVFDRYDIKVAVTNNQKRDTNTYNELLKRIKKEAHHLIIDKPQKITTQAGTEIEFLWPAVENIQDSNNASVVTYIKKYDKEILLTGDISKEVENLLTDIYNEKLKDIEILKVAHHGSKTSSGEGFIKHITPEYSIINYGKKNNYGHPHQSTIETLREHQSEIILTPNGQIKFVFDTKEDLTYIQ